MTPESPGFSGGTFDRADALRADAQALAQLRRHPQARLLQLEGFEAVLQDGALCWGAVPAELPEAALVLLGLVEGIAHFVALQDESNTAPLFRSPRTQEALAQLGPQDLAVYGTARSVLDWHARHRFCGRCGAPTLAQRGGWGRQCSGCGAEHFPRVDPVVIMVAEHGGQALLGRQASWPPGRYSTLAGFLEPGETIEEAVARELYEEAGVRALRVRYVTSQPWPFPAQLMLACVATVESAQLQVDANELEHAFWASPAEVLAALDGAPDARFLAPPRYAVAHSLLRHWAQGQLAVSPGA